MAFPIFWVTRYRQLVEQDKAVHIEMMTLDHAAARFPRTHLLGVLDRIRTTALELALSLEDASPEVGSPGGPTVATNEEVARAVNIGVLNVYGAGANLVIGENAKIVQIDPGDVPALLAAAACYLEDAGVQALGDAIEADGKVPGSATKAVLEKVKRGAIGAAAGISVNGAYDGLMQLLRMAFPDFGG